MSNPSAARASTAARTARGAASPMASAASALGSLALTPQQAQQAQPSAAASQRAASAVHFAAAASAASAGSKPLLGAPDEHMHEHKHHHHGGKRQRHDYAGHYSSARERNGNTLRGSGEHYKTTAFRPFIRDDEQARSYVTRCYQTNSIIFENTNGDDNTGRAFSFRGTWDPTGNGSIAARVYYGGPAGGTDSTVRFANLDSESSWFCNVFRYVKIKKFQINVTRMPAQAMIGTLVVPGTDPGSTQVVQNGYQSNMMDPGYIVLRPWAGEPAVASYADGTLSSEEWPDYMRHKEKVVRPAASEHGAQQVMKMCVQPISLVDLAEDSVDSTGDIQYEYVPTPSVDVARLKTNMSTLNSFGILLWWYYPAASGAVTGAFKIAFNFTVELAWYGLNIPTGIPTAVLPAGQVYEDDIRAELRSDVAVVERERKPKEQAVVFKEPVYDLMTDAVLVKPPVLARQSR